MMTIEERDARMLELRTALQNTIEQFTHDLPSIDILLTLYNVNGQMVGVADPRMVRHASSSFVDAFKRGYEDGQHASAVCDADELLEKVMKERKS